MRAVMVVVVTPCREQVTGMTQAGEQVFVEALVPQAAVGALDEAVLHAFARRNIVPFDLPEDPPHPTSTRCRGAAA